MIALIAPANVRQVLQCRKACKVSSLAADFTGVAFEVDVPQAAEQGQRWQHCIGLHSNITGTGITQQMHHDTNALGRAHLKRD